MDSNSTSSSSLEDFRDIMSRFQQGFPQYIACEDGWNSIIIKCHRELALIDPGYSIAQIKEKFGGLRYYFSTSRPEIHKDMCAVIRTYESISFETCEICGKKGSLVSGRILKTLCRKHSEYAGERS